MSIPPPTRPRERKANAVRAGQNRLHEKHSIQHRIVIVVGEKREGKGKGEKEMATRCTPLNTLRSSVMSPRKPLQSR